jgi:hypothetical protein
VFWVVQPTTSITEGVPNHPEHCRTRSGRGGGHRPPRKQFSIIHSTTTQGMFCSVGHSTFRAHRISRRRHRTCERKNDTDGGYSRDRSQCNLRRRPYQPCSVDETILSSHSPEHSSRQHNRLPCDASWRQVDAGNRSQPIFRPPPRCIAGSCARAKKSFDIIADHARRRALRRLNATGCSWCVSITTGTSHLVAFFDVRQRSIGHLENRAALEPLPNRRNTKKTAVGILDPSIALDDLPHHGHHNGPARGSQSTAR